MFIYNIVYTHRRRIYTEEKAKVDATAGGTKLIQFLAMLTILHQVDLKKKKGIILFFNSSKYK